jgi:hypothetical protein
VLAVVLSPFVVVAFDIIIEVIIQRGGDERGQDLRRCFIILSTSKYFTSVLILKGGKAAAGGLEDSPTNQKTETMSRKQSNRQFFSHGFFFYATPPFLLLLHLCHRSSSAFIPLSFPSFHHIRLLTTTKTWMVAMHK